MDDVAPTEVKPRGRAGGRKPGSLNKATKDIKALAQQYAPDTMRELHRIAMESESDQARVAAIKEIHDRGYGRPKQEVEMNAHVSHESVLDKVAKAENEGAI